MKMPRTNPAAMMRRFVARRTLMQFCAGAFLLCSAAAAFARQQTQIPAQIPPQNPVPAVTPAPAQTPAQASVQAQSPAGSPAIGTLSGDDVAVSGALSFNSKNGRSTAILGSGSEITVRSGQARIQLTEGGAFSVCGPAHFTVLKSGAAITLALDYGRVHPVLDANVPLTIYTPQVVANAVSVDQTPTDLTVGLTQEGAMCSIATRGALNIQQQLSGQSLLVPQGGGMNLDGGQLSAEPVDTANCTCDLQVSRTIPPEQLELSVPVHPTAAQLPVAPPPAPEEQPVYMVYMPPLTFDATAPEPPPAADPQTILLVREARVQPEVVFRGHVEAAPASASLSPAARAAGASQKKANDTDKRPGFLAKIFGVFRHRKNSPACAGVGCPGGPAASRDTIR